MDEEFTKIFKMNLEDIKIFSKEISGKLFFNYNLRKNNWFNIGGKAKIFFIPKNLNELISFLKLYNKRSKIFILGAGSNILFSDNIFDGVVIKLGKNFSNLSILNKEIIVAGSIVSDKKLSEFAFENSLSGFEFLSCIPGTVGGGIRMNSGCYGKEFKDVLLSVQAIDMTGKVTTISKDKIIFTYRGCNLPKDLIFLSASLKGKLSDKNIIKKKINLLKEKKELTQPTRIKTGGSTFKNPVEQTNEKVWELIKKSVPLDAQFGDAMISQKHCNFFINRGNASYEDMKNLLNFVKENVFSKTGIKLSLEIILVE
tara:strand:+ start:1721 stop:2659 length:939 start_codon:yes stop_codon:yes gene_type:complete